MKRNILTQNLDRFIFSENLFKPKPKKIDKNIILGVLYLVIPIQDKIAVK